MFKRKRLTLEDIEDEDDKKHRHLKKQQKARKEIQLLFGNEEGEEEDLVPVFSLRLKQVESKLRHRTTTGKLCPVDGVSGVQERSSILHGPETVAVLEPGIENEQDSDSKPVLVLDEFNYQNSLSAIKDVSPLCRKLIDRYEQRDLQHLFDSAETNCSFRLFLYSVAFGHSTDDGLESLFVDVLRQLSAEDQAESSLREQFGSLPKKEVSENPISLKKIKKFREIHRIPNNHIVRISAPLQVPRHIQKLFN